mmetsp:Transcript_52938/g.63742  ORF Transcript_52938/g.63742 Transcript_52938/m.63742 type:complete len:688 (-) Transcript_52938:290-2353(-)
MLLSRTCRIKPVMSTTSIVLQKMVCQPGINMPRTEMGVRALFSTSNNFSEKRNNDEFYGAFGALLMGASAVYCSTMTSSPSLLEQKKKKKKKQAEEEEEYQYQRRPKQKYESPPPIPVHGPESHIGDYNDPPPRPDLPTIPLAEVEEHCDDDSMWFTFRGAVYDMTFFLNGHPGGKPRLQMAAGQDLEPYWEVYRQHFRGHVVGWMEKYRIGNLSPSDAKEAATKNTFGDMFEDSPEHDPNLLVAAARPFNGEPRIDLLTRDYYTPNELFYVRNHLNCPDIIPKDYRLIVKGRGIKKHVFTLDDLKTKFPKYEVVTTLQCAGNRREDLHGERKIFISPHWVVGAMSNAKWGGARMRDVLEYCGLDVDAMALGTKTPKDITHLEFEGYDADETGYTYGISIPIDKAVDGLGDVLCAYEMNGRPLPRNHGFPVRAIVPGHVGNTNCKWLHKVMVKNKPTDKPWCQKSYRGFPPDIDFENDLSHWPGNVDMENSTIVQTMPVQSFICNPPQNSLIGMRDATDIELKGVAWSGGGKEIKNVDVSIDGGRNWTSAKRHKPIQQRRDRHWAWTQFSKKVTLTPEIREKLGKGERVNVELISKAMNSDFNVQPETMEPYWNARGVCINHWYRVKVTLDPNLEKGTVMHGNVEDEFPNTPSGGKFKEPWGMGGFTSDYKHQSDPRARKAPESAHF